MITWGWPFLFSFVYWGMARLGKIDWHWGVNAALLSVAIIIMLIGILRTPPRNKAISKATPNDKVIRPTPDNTDQNVARWIEARFPRRVVLMDDRYHFMFEVQVPQSHQPMTDRKKKPSRVYHHTKQNWHDGRTTNRIEKNVRSGAGILVSNDKP